MRSMNMSQIGDLIPGAGSANNFGPVPQNQRKVTDLSPHVDGGPPSASGSNAAASVSERATLHLAAGIVIAALVLLWLMGAVLFRSASL